MKRVDQIGGRVHHAAKGDIPLASKKQMVSLRFRARQGEAKSSRKRTATICSPGIAPILRYLCLLLFKV